MDIAHNSILAKLLAKENITVFSGNFATAYFDCENRHLGLPNWKGIEKETSDLFISHEVGHALWTPVNGIEIFQKRYPNIPFSVLNVVEDIRIEKKIKNQYPGLITSYRIGYTNLLNENFFGINGASLDAIRFIDRINIKAKVGELLNVPFNPKEHSLFQEALQVETFNDVLLMCEKIYEFTLDEVQEKKPKEQSSSNEKGEPNENTKISNGNPEKKESKTPEGDKEKTKEKEAASPDDLNAVQRKLRSETDKSLDQAMQSKAAHTPNTSFFIEPDKKKILEGVIDYKKFYSNRDKRDKGLVRGFERKTLKDKANSDFPEFMREIRRNVSILSTEFNRKKAAYEYTRATESKTGKINLCKLHSYKYNEDIFLTTTQLAQAKDHGLILLIDYSQSMERQISVVISQAIAIAEFCKTVSIPFSIYTFTIGQGAMAILENVFCKLNLRQHDFSQILSSEMSKAEYTKAIKYLHFLSFMYRENNRPHSHLFNFETMGGTPLNDALVTLKYLTSIFQAKYKVQKMNLMVITDGEGMLTDIIRSNAIQQNLKVTKQNTPAILSAPKLVGVIDNKKIAISVCPASNTLTQHVDFTAHLQGSNISLIGFYIPLDSHYVVAQASKALCHAEDSYTNKELREQYKKQGFIKMDNTLGYNTYFITPIGKDLKDKDDEFKVKTDASLEQIEIGFEKFVSSKKSNRIFLTEFVRSIV